MTPKEALEVLFNNLDQARLKELSRSDKYWYKYEEVSEAINVLERLKEFKETFDNYELAKRQDFVAFENWLECERELVVIKSDVKRFMELLEEQDIFNSQEEHNEFSLLYSKLLEVCAEE